MQNSSSKQERIAEYNRITVGSREQMAVLLRETEAILKEAQA